MALTYTPAEDLGRSMPTFTLKDVMGVPHSSTDVAAAPAKVIVFMCGHCPYVQAIEDRLIILGRDLKKMNVAMFGICSNDPTDYPEDRPEALLQRWKEKNYSFPLLLDTDQSVAKTYGAVCTPDFFVFDGDGRLAYRGRLDDSWKKPSLVTRHELFEAVQDIVSGKRPTVDQHPSMGCSIKWKGEDA